MRLVIDSNRFMAGLIKPSACRKIILHKDFTFYSPDRILSEIEKYRDYLIEKSKLSEREFDILSYTLLEYVTLIPFNDFEKEFEIAFDIMKDIDVKDTSFLAVGFAVNAQGIWTEDDDFLKQTRLRVYSTKSLLEII